MSISTKQEKFSKGVLLFLTHSNYSEISIMSEFYEECCALLALKDSPSCFKSNTVKIRYRFLKMKKAGVLDWKRSGVGALGKTDFGMTSLNFYFKAELG